jgi:hypothetical protein
LNSKAAINAAKGWSLDANVVNNDQFVMREDTTQFYTGIGQKDGDATLAYKGLKDCGEVVVGWVQMPTKRRLKTAEELAAAAEELQKEEEETTEKAKKAADDLKQISEEYAKAQKKKAPDGEDLERGNADVGVCEGKENTFDPDPIEDYPGIDGKPIKVAEGTVGDDGKEMKATTPGDHCEAWSMNRKWGALSKHERTVDACASDWAKENCARWCCIYEGRLTKQGDDKTPLPKYWQCDVAIVGTDSKKKTMVKTLAKPTKCPERPGDSGCEQTVKMAYCAPKDGEVQLTLSEGDGMCYAGYALFRPKPREQVKALVPAGEPGGVNGIIEMVKPLFNDLMQKFMPNVVQLVEHCQRSFTEIQAMFQKKVDCNEADLDQAIETAEKLGLPISDDIKESVKVSIKKATQTTTGETESDDSTEETSKVEQMKEEVEGLKKQLDDQHEADEGQTAEIEQAIKEADTAKATKLVHDMEAHEAEQTPNELQQQVEEVTQEKEGAVKEKEEAVVAKEEVAQQLQEETAAKEKAEKTAEDTKAKLDAAMKAIQEMSQEDDTGSSEEDDGASDASKKKKKMSQNLLCAIMGNCKALEKDNTDGLVNTLPDLEKKDEGWVLKDLERKDAGYRAAAAELERKERAIEEQLERLTGLEREQIIALGFERKERRERHAVEASSHTFRAEMRANKMIAAW